MGLWDWVRGRSGDAEVARAVARELAEREDQLRQDAWANMATGLGVYGVDKTRAAQYLPVWRVLDQELTSLMNGSDIAWKIVSKPVDEMFRRGFQIESEDIQPSDRDDLRDWATEYLEVEQNFQEGMRWGRGYGGSLLVLNIDDGRKPWEPLDEENIRSFNSMALVDRRYAYVQSQYASMSGPKYGRPEIYLISNAVAGYGWNQVGAEKIAPIPAQKLRDQGATVQLVHESRVIRFDGKPADVVTRQNLAGWSWSVLQVVYETMRQFDGAFDSATYLLHDASQGVLKLQGLIKAIGAGQRAALAARMQALDTHRSVLRTIALDAGGADGKNAETFERSQTPFGGIPDLLDKVMLRLAAAADMPATVLFGRAPAGMNATGESDLRNWYDALGSLQTKDLGPKLKRVYRLLALAKSGPLGGKDVKWTLKFHPLQSPTDKELAETRLANAQRDQIYIDFGVVKPEEVAVDLAEVYPNMDVEAREDVIEAGLMFKPYENEPTPEGAAAVNASGQGEPLSPRAPVALMGTTGGAESPGTLPAVQASAGASHGSGGPPVTVTPAKPAPKAAAGKGAPPAKKQTAAERKKLDRQDAAALFALEALLVGRQDADYARAVFEQLLHDYHAKDLGWVLKLEWNLETVPLDRVNFASRDRWKASHDGTLKSYVEKLREGRVKPVIYVLPPGDDAKYEPVDGHHRTLANEALGRDPVAYTARVPSAEGPWAHLHSLQKKGSSKLPPGEASRGGSRDPSRAG